MQVSNFLSANGNPVPNQFHISSANITIDAQERVGDLFQSYDSLIAFIDSEEGKVYLDATYWNYSRTTGKYRNQFLGEGIAETRFKIKEGKYLLVDLNDKH